MKKAKKNLLEKLGKKGFDTEKKVNAIDMQVAYDNGLTDDLGGILALQKAIKSHSVYSFLMDGVDPAPVKKEARKNADDDRTARNRIPAETYEGTGF